MLQVLAGEEGIYLKFVAKGDSAPTDSPGELYVTVSIIIRHAILLAAWIRDKDV